MNVINMRNHADFIFPSRWRGGRGTAYDQNRQSGQQQRLSAPRDKSSNLQQNARHSNQIQNPGQGPIASSTPNLSASDRSMSALQSAHVPVGGYNAVEVEQAFKRGMADER